MSDFIQLHLLTAYPPANLNRDDLGRPKTANVGGSQRLRISSQSLKRTWRISDIFQHAIGNYRGYRTKHLGRDVFAKLTEAGIAEKKAWDWAKQIAQIFGEVPGKESLDTRQLVHISQDEWDNVNELVEKLIAEQREPEKTIYSCCVKNRRPWM